MVASIGVPNISPLLAQAISRQIFSRYLVEQFASVQSPQIASSYVKWTVVCLKRKYREVYEWLCCLKTTAQIESDKTAQFVDGPSGMAVEGPESSFYEYMK